MKTYWKIADENGDYVDAAGKRYAVYSALDVSLPDGMEHYECADLNQAITKLSLAVAYADGWVDKRAFIKALQSLIPVDQLQPIATSWQTIFAIAQLPGEAVDTTDADLIAFVAGVGLTMSAVLAAME